VISVDKKDSPFAEPGDCILFATADWDEPYWTNKQHCATELARLGWRVLYVESVGMRAPRAASGRDWHRLADRLRKGLVSLFLGAPERAPGIAVMSPLMIPAGHNHPFWKWINRFLLRLGIWRYTVGKKFSNPLIWTYHPYMLDAIKGLQHSSLLYHCVDDLAAVPGVDAIAYRKAENELLQQADVVFATAPSLAERCKAINPNTHYLSNVVDADHFGRALQPGPIPEDLAAIPEPRLGYHGVLSDFKIDFELLLECAVNKPEWSWVFIGEEREGQKSPVVAELAKLPNVYFLGYRSYDLLPDYLRGIQVGLLPSQINEYTAGMFPMKYYEYLAAGLPVVSTPLAFTDEFISEIAVAHDGVGFLSAIESQLRRGKLKLDDQRVLVGNNTWKDRTIKMLSLL
jgi:glycosyltransferase involved in cell wall biosynthesis